MVCVLNREDPNIPELEDEDGAPPVLAPENVINPAEVALHPQPQEIADENEELQFDHPQPQFIIQEVGVPFQAENVACVLNNEDPNIPELEDEDGAPPELIPVNVINPVEVALHPQPQEIADENEELQFDHPQPQFIIQEVGVPFQAAAEEFYGVPILDPLLQDANGEFLVPFASLPFAPRGIGKLNVARARPPVPMNIDPPVLDAAPPVLDAVPLVLDAAPPMVDATWNVEPVLLPLPTVVDAVPSNTAALNVVEPPFVVVAGPSATGLNDVVERPILPSEIPEFVGYLYEFLMRAIEDPNLSTVMKWTDDHTFKGLSFTALATLYPLYFGSERWERFDYECERYGMVPVGDNEWWHRHGYLCKGRPESLQAIQLAMKEEGQATEQNLEIPPRNGDSSSC